jgi:hypothetical protein
VLIPVHVKIYEINSEVPLKLIKGLDRILSIHA